MKIEGTLGKLEKQTVENRLNIVCQHFAEDKPNILIFFENCKNL